jgi:hypothetical protein
VEEQNSGQGKGNATGSRRPAAGSRGLGEEDWVGGIRVCEIYMLVSWALVGRQSFGLVDGQYLDSKG